MILNLTIEAYRDLPTRLANDPPFTVRTGRPCVYKIEVSNPYDMKFTQMIFTPLNASVAVECAPYSKVSKNRSAARCL